MTDDLAQQRWTPERRRQLTRDALVESATQVFARRGFDAATLDEIAENAGFTRGAIYSNFADKEDLFFAVIDRHQESQYEPFATFLVERGLTQPGGLGQPIGEIARAWREITQGTDTDWLALNLEFRLHALRNPETRERLAQHWTKSREAAAAFLSEMLDAGNLTVSVPVEDLAAICDLAGGSLMELAAIDPTQDHVFETFVQLIESVVEDRTD